MNIDEFRKQNPQYGDMNDSDLADSLYSKFYSDMDRVEFADSFLRKESNASIVSSLVTQPITDVVGKTAEKIINPLGREYPHIPTFTEKAKNALITMSQAIAPASEGYIGSPDTFALMESVKAGAQMTDAMAHAARGLLAFPVSKAVGLYVNATFGAEMAKKAERALSEYITGTPTTEEAKNIFDTIGTVAGLPFLPAQKAGEFIGDIQPEMGYAIGTALEFATPIILHTGLKRTIQFGEIYKAVRDGKPLQSHLQTIMDHMDEAHKKAYVDVIEKLKENEPKTIIDELKKAGFQEELAKKFVEDISDPPQMPPVAQKEGGVGITPIGEEKVGVGAFEEPPRSKEGYEQIISDISNQISKDMGEFPIGRARGLSIDEVGGIPVAKDKLSFKFENPETEAAFRAAQGVPKIPLFDRVKDVFRELWQDVTRTYKDLPNTELFYPAQVILKRLEKGHNKVSYEVLNAMRGETYKFNTYQMDVFSRKVILDDLKYTIGEGKEIPFGFTKEMIEKELSRLDAEIIKDPTIQGSLTRRKNIQDALITDYVKLREFFGDDVAKRFQNENYYRHQVLEYAKGKSMAGTGEAIHVPVGRGFLKERKGSEKAINTNYLEAEYEYRSQMLYDIEIMKALKGIDKTYNIAKIVRQEYQIRLEQLMESMGHTVEQLKYGMKMNDIPAVAYINTLKSKIETLEKGTLRKMGLEDWHSLIPESHMAWQPREGNVFYTVDSVPVKMAEQLRSRLLEEIGVTLDDLRTTIAIGGKRREIVIPNEIAAAVDHFGGSGEQSISPAKIWKDLLTSWKVWTLVSPRRYFKYNIRNMTGDADFAFVGNKSGFKETPRAIQELYEVMFHDKPMQGELKEWFDRGGMSSTLQAQEIGDINALTVFKNISEQHGGITHIPGEIWNKYWKTARLTTDFREAILRYANYKDYLKQIEKNNGRPNNYGASDPAKIDSLSNFRDKAYELSNDLLGAYDRISITGQWLRENAFPFWSWKEVNFKRYIQIAKNAADEGHMASTVGYKLLGSLAHSPYTAYRVGSFMLKATVLWSVMQVYNNTFFPNEEKDLSPEEAARPHVIFGRDKDGKVQYFNRIGALGDFLQWFGLDNAPKYVDNWFKGKQTLTEIGQDMAKSPINVIVQGANPFLKTPFEVATRQSMFPDVFKMGLIRDRGLFLARSLGLDNEYKAIAGIPSEGYASSLSNLFMYKADPGQSAYSYIYEEKKRFLDKLGKSFDGWMLTPRGQALYNIKLSIRYGDEDSLIKNMEEYQLLGGTSQGFKTSIKNMQPLQGLNKKEQKAFIESLNDEDLDRLGKAQLFYETVLKGKEVAQ